jgi:hypothetical protein
MRKWLPLWSTALVLGDMNHDATSCKIDLSGLAGIIAIGVLLLICGLCHNIALSVAG